MLVTGLKNESLSKIVSLSDADCTDVHKALRECAEEMLYKYKQKQAQGNTVKLGIKTHATEMLLRELNKVPEDPDATRKAISSGLKRHAEVLHNHEHLLSEKGNTYALLKQIGSLMERHGDTPASLLRYHELKNKLLGPHTPLNAEEKKTISTLDENKALTLQTLVTLDEKPCTEEAERECCELKIKQQIYSSLVVYIMNYQQLTLENYTFIVVFLLYFPGSQQSQKGFSTFMGLLRTGKT